MRIALAGDVMIGRLVNQALRGVPPVFPWGDTLGLFRQADWRCCNLECVLSDLEPPFFRWPKVFRFRSDARNVAVLRAAGINAVGLANNHTLDFEEDALLQMLEILDEANIARSGAGRDREEAAKPAVSEGAGRRIVLFSCTDNEPAWEATGDRPGIFYLPMKADDSRMIAFLRRIEAVKQAGPLVVVSVHWGSNWGSQPEPGHPAIGRGLIEAGADVVFGHSCHILRGVEIYRDRPIFYSCGDFLDDYAADPVERNDRACLFLLDLAPDGKLERLLLHPALIRNCQVNRAPPEEAAAIADSMTTLSAELGTTFLWNPEAGHLEWIH